MHSWTRHGRCSSCATQLFPVRRPQRAYHLHKPDHSPRLRAKNKKMSPPRFRTTTTLSSKWRTEKARADSLGKCRVLGTESMTSVRQPALETVNGNQPLEPHDKNALGSHILATLGQHYQKPLPNPQKGVTDFRHVCMFNQASCNKNCIPSTPVVAESHLSRPNAIFGTGSAQAE